QGFDRRRPVVGVVVGDEQSRVAVFDDFGQSSHRRGDRGQSGGGGLGGEEPEGFAARGKDEHVSGPIVIDEDVGGNGRADLDAGFGGDGGGQLPQIGRGSAAGQRGRRPGGASRVDAGDRAEQDPAGSGGQVRIAAPQIGQGVDGDVGSLDELHPTDVEDDGLVIGQAEPLSGRRLRGGSVEAVVDTGPG